MSPFADLFRAWRRSLSRGVAPAAFFLFLNLIYNSNLRPITTGDSLPTALIPLSILLDRSVTLDRFGPWLTENIPYSKGPIVHIGTHYQSLYPVAQSVLVTPFYVPPFFALRLATWDVKGLVFFARTYEKIVAALIAALSCVVMLLILRRLVSPAWAWSLSLLFAFGTTTWSVCSQALWQHTSGQFLLVSSLYFLTRWSERQKGQGMLWWAGLCAGLALLIRPTNLLFVVAVSIALLMARQPWTTCLRFGVFPLALGAVAIVDNMATFGSPLGGYGAYLNTRGSIPAGLLGLLVSPGRGLLVYSPFLAFAGFALPAGRGRLQPRLFLTTCATFFVVLQIMAISAWVNWWGGHSWGPRLLTEITPFLVLLAAFGTEKIHSRAAIALFAVFAVYSVFIEMIGVYSYPLGRWNGEPFSVDVRPDRLWDWKDNPIVRNARAGIEVEPFRLLCPLITSGRSAVRGGYDINAERWTTVPAGSTFVSLTKQPK